MRILPTLDQLEEITAGQYKVLPLSCAMPSGRSHGGAA